MTTNGATKTVLVVEESPLRTFIDRVVVSALVDQLLAEQDSIAVVVGERLHDGVAVRGVDPQQLQQHEPNRSALSGGPGLDALPELRVDTPQHVADHGCSLLPTICTPAPDVMSAGSRGDDLDHSQVASRPSRRRGVH
jgi:hypothetical protein